MNVGFKPAPGGAAWLLLHELRLFWYNAGGSPGHRTGRSGVVLAALIWLVLHMAGWFAMGALGGVSNDDPRILLAVTAILVASATFMLSTAIKSSVVTLFERGDLDLLLSSPLPSRSIFTVRLAGVAATSAGIHLFFLAPFAHGALLHGQWRWLGIYPALTGVAVLCACGAMLLTLGLVRMIGARRTRVVAQVLGALAGALLVIASQTHTLFRDRDRLHEFMAALGEPGGLLATDSLLWLPARALLGDAWPMLVLTLVAVAAFTITARRTHRFFAVGLQLSASSSQVSSANSAAPPQPRFGRSLFATVVIKEWRLIVRDPQLISQVLLQLLYLMPLCFAVFRDSGVHVPAVGAGLTLLASSLAGSLAWVALSAEDAPDLLLLSPVSAHTLRRAKLAAAVMPVLLLTAAPLLWLIVYSALAGLVLCFTVSAAVLGAGMIVFWCGRPGVRSNFKANGERGFVMNVLQVFHSLGWGALAWLLTAATLTPPSLHAMLGAGAAFTISMLMLASARFIRQVRDRAV
jgi:ABC-2 type transport system permease protein